MTTKRHRNWTLWAGFGLVLAGFLSFVPVFARFPFTRDFPWVNLLMFAAGLWLLGVGLVRAYRHRDQYRGRVVGPILALLSVASVALFVFGVFVHARNLPASAAAPHVGEPAPAFTLPDQDGRPVSLAELVSTAPIPSPATALAGASLPSGNGALLIFYRGHW